MEDITCTEQQLTTNDNTDTEQQLTNTAATEVTQITSDEATLAIVPATQEVTIAELHPMSCDKILEARVYRKWIATTYQKSGRKIETGLCCILIDREGNAIQANMNIKDIDYFNPKINVGSVYKFSEFMCEPTNPYQQTINNKTSLRFGRITKFELTTTTTIPHHYFEFTSYNQLHTKIPTQDATGKMHYPILTDYIGCLGTVGALNKKGGPNEDETVYRKVDIENLNGNIVEFTMWDETARSFEHACSDKMEKPIIIAVSSCRVSKFRDYQLTATSATYCYLNPDIPEATHAREQYRARHAVNPPLRIYKTRYEDIEKEKFRNRFPLKTLLSQSADSYKGVQFTTEATITSINTQKNWYYMSCNECNSKVKEDGGIYRCVNHGRQSHPSYRYNFKAFITDPSATAEVTFFTPAADDVTGYSCPQLLAIHKASDPQEIPPEIFAIEGEKNVFQIHYNTTGKTTSFILDQVFNKKKHEDTTPAAIEANPATPPTTLTITSQEDSQEIKNKETRSKAVKRPLFQEQPHDQKNQKTPEEASTKDSPKQKTPQKHKSD